MQRGVYQSLRGAEMETDRLALMRRKRLNKEENHWGTAIVLDVLLGIGPWVAAACALAGILYAIYMILFLQFAFERQRKHKQS